MRPLIIVSPSINETEDEIKLSRAYCKAVYSAGGIAFASDYGNARDIAERADGILFAGGGDIEPVLTGDEADPAGYGQISRARDAFEFELLRLAMEKDLPVLGICRGMQVIGAVMGAHIIQHMEGHMQDRPKTQTYHSVKIENGSLLKSITNMDSLEVNSFHHQAVGEGFQGLVSAVSDDGFIEAVEACGKKFVLGVQWHPELLCSIEEHFKIFMAFINAAGRYKGCR